MLSPSAPKCSPPISFLANTMILHTTLSLWSLVAVFAFEIEFTVACFLVILYLSDLRISAL